MFIPELGTSFQCPPTFRIFAAQNPVQEGGGRRGLPKSFLNRFTRVHVELLDVHDLQFIAGGPSIHTLLPPHCRSWCKMFEAVSTLVLLLSCPVFYGCSPMVHGAYTSVIFLLMVLQRCLLQGRCILPCRPACGSA